MRHPLVMGNWKLNGSRHMVNELVANLRTELAGVSGCAVAIAPPEMYLDLAKRAAEGSHIHLGAQNVDVNLSGAFTGETSAEMLKDRSQLMIRRCFSLSSVIMASSVFLTPTSSR